MVRVALVLFGMLVISRLLPLPPNCEPLLGLAVLTPYFTKNNLAFILPLLVMFVSDMFLGFHSSMLMTYSALAVAPYISRYFEGRMYLSLISSWLVWHIMANLGQMYPPFSLEALVFDLRFLGSGLSIVLLYDIMNRVYNESITHKKS